MDSLRQFKNYIVYNNVYCYYCSMFIETYVYMHVYQVSSSLVVVLPSIVYGLRLFIVVVQELHCLSNCLHVGMIRVRVCYHFTKFCCSTPAGF